MIAMNKLPSVIFMGTPDFARVSLQRLADDGFPIKAVVTQPDRPQGRRNLLISSPVKALALELGLPVFQPERLPDITTGLKALAPDFIAVVAFGQILDRQTLDLPCAACASGAHRACVNVHASLLPKYRGASPIQSALWNGDRVTGVTTMLMERGLDTGPVLLREETPVSDDDTFETLHDRLAVSGAGLLARTLITFDAITPRPQDHAQATVTEKFTRQHGEIDWNLPAEDIHNRARACTPWPAAYTAHNGNRLIVWRTRPVDCGAHGAAPGTVLEIRPGQGIVAAAATGCIAISELQRQGKKRLPFNAFLNGYPLAPGDRFDPHTSNRNP